MAAPSSAYNTLDMTLLTVAHKVAKLTGKHNTLANAKANFHLDKVFAKRDDTTGALIGFIGAVIENGTNAAWRSSSRLSRTRVIDDVGGTRYRLLLDAGLNIQGYASGLVVKYAFCNYFRLDITAYGAPYEGCTVHAAIKQTSSSSSADAYSTSGSVGQAASKVFQMVNRGGYQYWDKAGTYAVVVDVSNGEGTRTYAATAQFLPPLNFDAFIPVSSVTSTPDKSSSGIKTFLIDSVAVDEILNTVKDMSASSLPIAIAFMQGDDNVALLGDGRVSGEASDSFLEAYYKYVKNGTGSYTKAPDGLWVCETMKTAYNGAIRVDLYYGIQIQSGRIRGVFRAKTPQMPDTRPTMTLNIDVSKVSGYTNRYRVTISLSATANNGAASVAINSLNVRKTQTGPALAGSFTSNGVSPITYPVTVTYSASGISVMWSCILVTTTAEPFWVTATLQSTALTNYRLVNNGGQSGSGSGTVNP